MATGITLPRCQSSSYSYGRPFVCGPSCWALQTTTPSRSRGHPSHLNAAKLRTKRKVLILPLKATTDQSGKVEQGDDDSKILQYCSIDGKQKKSLGEMEQEFLEALQMFYYEGKAIMSNEEFDNLKEELMWEGSSVVMLSSEEQKFLEASMAYVSGKPIMSDQEFDKLKLQLKIDGSEIVSEGPRCSLRSRKIRGYSFLSCSVARTIGVLYFFLFFYSIFILLLPQKQEQNPKMFQVYSDLYIDYLKMFLLNVPATLVAVGLFFFLDDLTGFEITFLLELPEPFSFIFTWFAAIPFLVWGSTSLTRAVLRDFLILKGPCPNCATENTSFFGTILSVSSGGSTNAVKCTNCGTNLVYDSSTRLITLPEGAEA